MGARWVPGNIRALLCSPFCVGQTVVNIVASFVFPLAFFAFMYDTKGPVATQKTYSWLDSTPLGVVLASPWIAAVLSCGPLPIGLPEALQKRWFGTLAAHDVRWLLGWQRCGPLRIQRGVLRHLALGTLVAPLCIPLGLLALRYGAGDTFSDGTLVWFCSTYIALLPILIVPLGLLGFALPLNYQRVEERLPLTVAGQSASRKLLGRLLRTWTV